MFHKVLTFEGKNLRHSTAVDNDCFLRARFLFSLKETITKLCGSQASEVLSNVFVIFRDATNLDNKIFSFNFKNKLEART